MWFRLRMIEDRKMPMPVRKVLVNGLLRDPSTDHRYKKIEDREVLFVHVPKIGGTSLAKSLGLPHGHVPVSRYIARDKARFDESFSFAFVRNPWDRLFSAFNYLKASIGLNRSRDVRWAEQNLGSYANFEAFVLALKDDAKWRRIRRWPHFRAQTDWLCVPGSNVVKADFIGRFETLNDDCNRLAGMLGQELTLSHERKSQSYEHKKLTQQMINIIGRRYRSDVDLFKYDTPI